MVWKCFGMCPTWCSSYDKDSDVIYFLHKIRIKFNRSPWCV